MFAISERQKSLRHPRMSLRREKAKIQPATTIGEFVYPNTVDEYVAYERKENGEPVPVSKEESRRVEASGGWLRGARRQQQCNNGQQVKIQHLGGLQFPSFNCGDHAPQLSSIRGKVLVNAVTGDEDSP